MRWDGLVAEVTATARRWAIAHVEVLNSPSDTSKWESSHPLTGDLPSNPSGADPDAVTSSGMPRRAPPAAPHGRLRGAGPTRPLRTAHRPSAVRSVTSPATGSVSGWAFGGSAPSAAELDALWLNTDLLRQRGASTAPTAEGFTPLHSGAAAPAPATTSLAFTRLDAKGRLPVPQCPLLDVRLAAERDGALLVVFLPGVSGTPRPGYDTPLLRVDARRRLLLGGQRRAQLGLGDNATVVVRADADRNVLELMAPAGWSRTSTSSSTPTAATPSPRPRSPPEAAALASPPCRAAAGPRRAPHSRTRRPPSVPTPAEAPRTRAARGGRSGSTCSLPGSRRSSTNCSPP